MREGMKDEADDEGRAFALRGIKIARRLLQLVSCTGCQIKAHSCDRCDIFVDPFPMATIRPAKPDDWTQYELDHCGIRIKTQNKQKFFGSDDLPVPAIPSLAGFMTTEDREHAVDPETRKLLQYLDLVIDPQIGQEAAVDNFAAKLLETLGYDEGDRITYIRRALPIVFAGVSYITQADVCVMDGDNQILLILQDTLLPSLKDPEPQIVAKAIAAYEANKEVRASSLNLPPFPTITFPAISMIGTKFIFYKIPVTGGLSASVRRGVYGGENTVFRYIPVLPERHGQGMRPLGNRAEILACLAAFKQFVGN
jgi:hypothetical protein